MPLRKSGISSCRLPVSPRTPVAASQVPLPWHLVQLPAWPLSASIAGVFAFRDSCPRCRPLSGRWLRVCDPAGRSLSKMQVSAAAAKQSQLSLFLPTAERLRRFNLRLSAGLRHHGRGSHARRRGAPKRWQGGVQAPSLIWGLIRAPCKGM